MSRGYGYAYGGDGTHAVGDGGEDGRHVPHVLGGEDGLEELALLRVLLSCKK